LIFARNADQKWGLAITHWIVSCEPVIEFSMSGLPFYVLNDRRGILVASGAETCRINHQAALQHQREGYGVIARPETI
jgi:hypothetical protein